MLYYRAVPIQITAEISKIESVENFANDSNNLRFILTDVHVLGPIPTWIQLLVTLIQMFEP